MDDLRLVQDLHGTPFYGWCCSSRRGEEVVLNVLIASIGRWRGWRRKEKTRQNLLPKLLKLDSVGTSYLCSRNLIPPCIKVMYILQIQTPFSLLCDSGVLTRLETWMACLGWHVTIKLLTQTPQRRRMTTPRRACLFLGRHHLCLSVSSLRRQSAHPFAARVRNRLAHMS